MTRNHINRPTRWTSIGARVAVPAVLGAGLLGLAGGVAQAQPVDAGSPVLAARSCGTLQSYPEISRGSSGQAVTYAQCLLYGNWGENVDVDGQFGPATEAAVKRVQSYCGLDADGIVGRYTWSALYRGC